MTAHPMLQPMLVELIRDQLDAWVAGELPYAPGHVIAVVLEGHCPRCLTAMAPGRHGALYAWCPTCQLGFHAQRCTEAEDLALFGDVRLTVLWPSAFGGCGPA